MLNANMNHFVVSLQRTMPSVHVDFCADVIEIPLDNSRKRSISVVVWMILILRHGTQSHTLKQTRAHIRKQTHITNINKYNIKYRNGQKHRNRHDSFIAVVFYSIFSFFIDCNLLASIYKSVFLLTSYAHKFQFAWKLSIWVWVKKYVYINYLLGGKAAGFIFLLIFQG